MHLTPQERALYERHLKNLNSAGGVDNPDGSRSTLYQMTVNIDGKERLIPRVWDGKILSERDAIARAEREGLDKFPAYRTPEEAEQRYQRMHDFMERDTAEYLQRRPHTFDPGVNRSGRLSPVVQGLPQDDPAGRMLRGGLSFKPGAVDQFPSSTNIEDRRSPQSKQADAQAFHYDGQNGPTAPYENPDQPGTAREGLYSQAAHRLLEVNPNISGKDFLRTMKAMAPMLRLDLESEKASHRAEMDELKARQAEERAQMRDELASQKEAETERHHKTEEQLKEAGEQRKQFEALIKQHAEERKQLELQHKEAMDAVKEEQKRLKLEFEQSKEQFRRFREMHLEGARQKRQEQADQRLKQGQQRLDLARKKLLDRSNQSYGGPEGGAASSGSKVLDDARDAIKRGAPKDKVIQRLKELGLDATGL